MDKQHIIDEIRRTAAANGGKPLGRARFYQETGVKETDWSVRFWPRWSAAVEEAGFTPLQLQGKNNRVESLQKLAALTRKLGKLPTTPEMKLEKRIDSEFPSHNSVLIAGREALRRELQNYCRSNEGYEDVEKILIATPSHSKPDHAPEAAEKRIKHGYVYLLISGKNYKIGHSISALSRASAVSNMTPEGAVIDHLIRTDDPRGIEAYWHNRFADKRGNGEWFALSSADVAAFKRRKFM